MEYQDRISHLNGSAKTAGEDPRPRKVHHDPGCPDECWSFLICHLERLCHQIHDEFPNHCQEWD